MFSIKVSPRFGDADGLGHVNNTVLACWFELARNPVFRIFEPDLNPAHGKWPLIMAHSEYDFLDQIFIQYDVEIRTSIARIGVKSFTVYHEAWQTGRFCAKGNTVIVYYDYLRARSAPIPEDKKRLLSAHLVETRLEP